MFTRVQSSWTTVMLCESICWGNGLLFRRIPMEVV